MKEEWKIIDIAPMYEISTLGRVRRGDHLIKPSLNKGYLQVRISTGSTFITRKVHRLVAQAFIPNPDNLPFVNHKDENPSNAHVDNLEWCTHEYNVNYGTCQERRSKILRGHAKLGAAGRPMKTVLQVSGNSYIGVFESCQEASRKTGINDRHIGECCLFKRKSAGGFMWRRDLDYSLLSGVL